jgi:hypothetical protein
MTNPRDKWDLYIAAQKQRGRKEQNLCPAEEIRANESETELKELSTKGAAEGEALTFWRRVFGKRG